VKDEGDGQVTLERAAEQDLPGFMRDLQHAFEAAAIVECGTISAERLPPDQDVQEAFDAPGAEILHVVSGGRRVGGAVLTIDDVTHHNALSLFFIAVDAHDRGLGYRAWQAIERRHPQTRVWETHTPYFEKRNIHFYVNKCGFRIVEFFNARHPDPHERGSAEVLGDDGFFRFEKQMQAG